jgi:hypothetical protein
MSPGIHDDSGKDPGKPASSTSSEMKRRSAIHKRMVRIYLDRHGVSGKDDREKWAECYRDAVREIMVDGE